MGYGSGCEYVQFLISLLASIGSKFTSFLCSITQEVTLKFRGEHWHSAGEGTSRNQRLYDPLPRKLNSLEAAEKNGVSVTRAYSE